MHGPYLFYGLLLFQIAFDKRKRRLAIPIPFTNNSCQDNAFCINDVTDRQNAHGIITAYTRVIIKQNG